MSSFPLTIDNMISRMHREGRDAKYIAKRINSSATAKKLSKQWTVRSIAVKLGNITRKSS